MAHVFGQRGTKKQNKGRMWWLTCLLTKAEWHLTKLKKKKKKKNIKLGSAKNKEEDDEEAMKKKKKKKKKAVKAGEIMPVTTAILYQYPPVFSV